MYSSTIQVASLPPKHQYFNNIRTAKGDNGRYYALALDIQIAYSYVRFIPSLPSFVLQNMMSYVNKIPYIFLH